MNQGVRLTCAAGGGGAGPGVRRVGDGARLGLVRLVRDSGCRAAAQHACLRLHGGEHLGLRAPARAALLRHVAAHTGRAAAPARGATARSAAVTAPCTHTIQPSNFKSRTRSQTLLLLVNCCRRQPNQCSLLTKTLKNLKI